MSWTYQRSLERIQRHLHNMGEIEVSKLVREADLEQLLSETVCRKIYGTHVYMQISNFARLASDSTSDQAGYKRLIQGVHIYQREVTRLVQGFGGALVHFQGPKLHALFYRPIDDGIELATRAILLQLTLKDFVKTAFNPAFPDYGDFTIAGATDLGDAIGTSDGINGDRELLFLGAPANYAAKIISSAHRLRLTQSIYDALPSDLQEICDQTIDGPYQLKPITSDVLGDLLKAYGLSWSREESADRIADDIERFPLKEIDYSVAEVAIDLDALSIYNSKRVLGASIFADISGFTKYIDEATSDEEKIAALRILHAIRKETAYVIKDDFGGLRIQYQGDRIQGLYHLPQDDTGAIAKKVVEAAVGLQSSIGYTLKECLPELGEKNLRLAIGIDIGTTLVSKLGARGQRDRICLGESVEDAALSEERCEGGEIGISKQIYTALPIYLSEFFTYNQAAKCFVATDLTQEKVERAAKAANYRDNLPVYILANSSGVGVSFQESPYAKPHVPSRPYAPEI